MARRLFSVLFCMFFAVMISSAEGKIVVLGETPVAEFRLPDGSVLKNAFAWRRNSEGLMVVHDDGQYFLNFALLPPDWKAAYLGTPIEVEKVEKEQEAYEIYDLYNLMPILETVPNLTPEGLNYVLRKDADPESAEAALALSILHSLLEGRLPDAKRLFLVLEEQELEVESVERDALFAECSRCDGSGRMEVACAQCKGIGKCPKCGGAGSRPSATGKTTAHCTTCRGKGVCLECGGEGMKTPVCRVCRGRGKLLERRYCEVKRDYFIHTVNTSAKPDAPVSVTQSDLDRILKALKALPELERGAAAFYASEEYTGQMDTNILVACTMNSLLKSNMEDAERFYMTLQVHYGEGSVVEIEKYLRTCDTCDGGGMVGKDCRTCSGSGKCPRCDGDGERDSEFLDRTTPCTTCRGTGKCKSCSGEGENKFRCGGCEATGRMFEKDRTQVKLQICVAELNRFYREQQ